MGFKGGAVRLVDETGDYITTTSEGVDYITQVVLIIISSQQPLLVVN